MTEEWEWRRLEREYQRKDIAREWLAEDALRVPAEGRSGGRRGSTTVGAVDGCASRLRAGPARELRVTTACKQACQVGQVRSARCGRRRCEMGVVRRDGLLGWGIIGAVVAVWDLWALRTQHTTLSSACYGAAHGRHGAVVVAGVVYLAAHLLGWPRAFREHDPLYVVGERLAGRVVGS